MLTSAPPRTLEELLQRADALAGRHLHELAAQRTAVVPPDLKRHKGWIGQLLEAVLGATSTSRAQPDFPHLDVELKTLPIDAAGKPRESTFVALAPLDPLQLGTFEESWLRHKLSRVLFVPIVGDGPPGERMVATPIFWRPSEAEWKTLQADWEEITNLIALGDLWQLDAKRGQALQVRPKGANADARQWALAAEGEWVRHQPRAFYLRAKFTAGVLARHFG